MKLTKNQLKRLVRGVIRESMEDRAHQLSKELMTALPDGCTWDEGLRFSMSTGYTEDEYARAIDLIGR